MKVIVITGGAGLLGSALCENIISNNGVAIIADVDKDKGLKVENELKFKYKNENIKFIQLDITSIASITNLIVKVKEIYGKIDVLINNAYPKNKNYGRDFFEVEFSDFCENVNMHLGGYFLMCQQFAKYFIEQGYGNIINISSVYGVIPPRFEIYENTNMTMPVEYAVIKSALLHLTKYLAKYLKGKNIRVNSLSPGGIYDNQPEKFLQNYKKFTLNKGMLDVKDIFGLVNFLISDDSIYINGQNIVIDDGFTL